jgi:hypothetical protein
MIAFRTLFGTLLGTVALAFGATDAQAQYVPPQYFAPGYGAYSQTYPTFSGGIVNRTSFTTPFGTTFTKRYYNPYTGFSYNNVSNFSQQPFGNFNSPFISPSLTPYYGGPGYGNPTTYVIPWHGMGARVR